MFEEIIKQLKEAHTVLSAINVHGDQDVFNMAYVMQVLGSLEKSLAKKAAAEEEEETVTDEI
jgi:hypothetical protein